MILSNTELLLKLLPEALSQTLYMVLASTIISGIIGTPVGILLCLTDTKGLCPKQNIYTIFSTIVNIGRSFPFSILIFAVIPLTRFIVGTSIGTTAAIVPLSIAAIPFFARLIESSLKDVDKSTVEAAKAMGATTFQIVREVMLPEALPSIISGLTLTFISLVGYSAIAGLVGGGGLGQVAHRYGYVGWNTTVMVVTIIVLIIIVQIIQWLGNTLATKLSRK